MTNQSLDRITTGVLFGSLLVALPVGAQEIRQLTRDQGVGKINISTPRPLMDTMDLMSEYYGAFVDYEDPPYTPEETRDSTDPGWRASHPFAKGARTVAGTSFNTTYQERFNEHRQLDLEPVLGSLVSEYNNSGNPGKFHLVVEEPNRYSVVGEPHDGSKPIFDTPITVPASNDTFEAILDSYLSYIQRTTGSSLVIGSAPMGLLTAHMARPALSGVPARLAIRQLLDSNGHSVRMVCLYDPDQQNYHVNFTMVVHRFTDSMGKEQIHSLDNERLFVQPTAPH